MVARAQITLAERCYGMLSIPTMFETVVSEPKLAAELLEKITAYKMGVAKNFVKMALDTGHVGDDLGTQTGSFVPPKIFTDLLLPNYKKLFAVYKDAGWVMSMHSCGCITKFLPELIDAGLDVLEPVQPCMDVPLANIVAMLETIVAERATAHGL